MCLKGVRYKITLDKTNQTKRNFMLTWIIVILLVLWLLGYFGPNLSSSFPRTGNVVHTLLVIAIILIVLRLLGIA